MYFNSFHFNGFCGLFFYASKLPRFLFKKLAFPWLSNRIEFHFQKLSRLKETASSKSSRFPSKRWISFVLSILVATLDDTPLFRLMICSLPKKKKKSIPYWNISMRDIFTNGRVYTNLECCLRCLMRFTINDFSLCWVLSCWVLNNGNMWWLSLFRTIMIKWLTLPKKDCMISNSCMYGVRDVRCAWFVCFLNSKFKRNSKLIQYLFLLATIVALRALRFYFIFYTQIKQLLQTSWKRLYCLLATLSSLYSSWQHKTEAKVKIYLFYDV